MQASFEGQMLRVETPDLLTFVNLARRTGLLEMERANQLTRLFFGDGDLVFATSTRQGLRLGDILLKVGKVSQRDLDRCLARPRAAGDRLGQVLVQERVLTEPELLSSLKTQVSEVLYDTFTWSDGRFAFYDDVSHPANVTTVNMSLQNLLMEGVRRVDERGRLAEVFPDHEAVVQSLANPEWVKDNMSLTPEEWSVFFLVDGRRTLYEVCQLAGNPDDLATLEILNHLQGGNLIGIVAAGQKEAPPAEPKPAPAQKTDSFSLEKVAAKLAALEAAPRQAASEAAARPASERPARPLRTDDSASVVSKTATQYVTPLVRSASLILEAPEPRISYPLKRPTYTLGRSPKNDIVLEDVNISLFHARVDRGATGFTLVDLRSTNGTKVNDQRIQKPVLLQPDDLLAIGLMRLRYVED